ncbi:MAG: hypothetical protein E2O68_00755 [Deltaproteobacteria bacterium]|nr:MAG: hypothetical protein E2O68_00755 [Deltaproteobacteria bacterium]
MKLLLLLLLIFGCTEYDHPRGSYGIFMENVNPLLAGSDYVCDISKWGLLNCKVSVQKIK